MPNTNSALAEPPGTLAESRDRREAASSTRSTDEATDV
jgi:hypothetical protein